MLFYLRGQDPGKRIGYLFVRFKKRIRKLTVEINFVRTGALPSFYGSRIGRQNADMGHEFTIEGGSDFVN